MLYVPALKENLSEPVLQFSCLQRARISQANNSMSIGAVGTPNNSVQLLQCSWLCWPDLQYPLVTPGSSVIWFSPALARGENLLLYTPPWKASGDLFIALQFQSFQGLRGFLLTLHIFWSDWQAQPTPVSFFASPQTSVGDPKVHRYCTVYSTVYCVFDPWFFFFFPSHNILEHRVKSVQIHLSPDDVNQCTTSYKGCVSRKCTLVGKVWKEWMNLVSVAMWPLLFFTVSIKAQQTRRSHAGPRVILCSWKMSCSDQVYRVPVCNIWSNLMYSELDSKWPF